MSVVENLADRLSLQILRGELGPGVRLPSLRTLANGEGVNVSTVQRVLVRLEERGLVETRDRSGVEVRDPSRYGGAALWPLVLKDATHNPDKALRLLSDVLETRRIVAAHVMGGLAEAISNTAPTELREAVAALETAIAHAPADLNAVAMADLEVTRVLLQLADKPAMLAVFNDVASVILSQPVLLDAFYGDPQRTLMGWQLFLVAVESGALAEHPESIQPLMKEADERALAAFEAQLGRNVR
jgi:DNA-binding FadR family transcriptional regulator